MKNKETKLCVKCGERIPADAKFCPKCGAPQHEVARNEIHIPTLYEGSRKNPGLSALLSAILCGAGQLYNGEIWKGVALILVQIVVLVLFNVAVQVVALNFRHSLATGTTLAIPKWVGPVLVISGIAGFAIWIYSIIDAYTSAARHNSRLP